MDESGANDHHARTRADQRVAQTLGERIESGFGRAVHVVGLSGAFGCYRREHDQRSVTLSPELFGYGETARHRTRDS